jgi:hypothetical protein
MVLLNSMQGVNWERIAFIVVCLVAILIILYDGRNGKPKGGAAV